MSSRAERSVVEGSSAPGSMQEGARIPPLRFGRNDKWGDLRTVLTTPVIPTGAKRNGGIFRTRFDAGQCQDSSTSLRFGGHDRRGDLRTVLPTLSSPPQVIPSGAPPPLSSRAERSVVEGSSAPGSMQCSARIPPLRFASVGMTYGGIFAPFYPLCHPERSEAEWRDLPHPVRCRRVPGFLHFASLRSE